MEILKKLFCKYFYFEVYQNLYKKYASLSDIPFLEDKSHNPDLTDFLKHASIANSYFADNKLTNLDKKYKREIDKLIEGLRKRKIQIS